MNASTPRSVFRRASSALLAGLLLLAGAVTVPRSPAAAQPQLIKGKAQYHGEYVYPGGDHPEVPDCGSINVDGRNLEAAWTVTSSLGPGSVVYPGHEWTVSAHLFGRIFSNGLHLGNNGPDPLIVELAPTGPVAPAASPTGKLFQRWGVTHGKGWVGPRGPSGPWGYEFDTNSNPVFGVSDEVDVEIEVKYRATGPGTISLKKLRVTGSDSTPWEAENIDCFMSIDPGMEWSWTVVEPELPTSLPDVARTDARYGADTVDDANGGEHGVVINVLANDNDPNVAGGPGDPSEVRVRDWQPKSINGGDVSCGTPAQKGAAKLPDMSMGPCVYKPPLDGLFEDKFAYLLRSVSGFERLVWVTVLPRWNTPPVASEVTYGAMVGTPDTFQLSTADIDGDPVSCFSELVPTNGGDVFVHEDCTADWTPKPWFTGTADFTYVACDTHPTLQNGELGTNVTRAAGYHDGDLDEKTSRRCSSNPAHVFVNEGMILPPVGVPDFDVVDSGYPGYSGPYSVEIPVLDNDYDPNGPNPAENASNVKVSIASKPQPFQGTATVTPDRRIRFTPASGYSGTAQFTYRLCEDPAQQKPPYLDNPMTPYNEGLPFCGLGTVAVTVIGNHAPLTEADEVTTASPDPVLDVAVAVNDTEPDGEGLVCTPGDLKSEPVGLIASATIDDECRVDATPVADTEGVAAVYYPICDDHHLTHPKYPAQPYGADGRSPGDPAPRCATGKLTVTIVAPYVPGPSEWDLDPAPVCVDDVATTPAGHPVVIAVLANDSDLNAKGNPSPLHLTGAGFEKQEGDIDRPEHATEQGGTALPGDDGQVTYTPPAGFVGTDTFVYSAQDSIGHGCGAKVTVTVLGTDGDGGGGNPHDGGGANPDDRGNNGGDDPDHGGAGGRDGTESGGVFRPAGVGDPGTVPGGSESGGSLPRTGFDLLAQVGSGLVLLAGGGTIWARTRRRSLDN